MWNQSVFKRWITVLGGIVAGATTVHSARADELVFVTAEAGAAVALNRPYKNVYNPGAQGGIGVFRSLAPQLSLGVRGAYGVLTEESGAKAGGYNFGLLTAVGRLRPLADDRPARATGLWLELGAGVGSVEKEARFVLTPALGYTFPAGALGVGPFARYIQVNVDEAKDARIGVLGVELVLFDSRETNVATRAGDRDGDGILDGRDSCPDDPETFNGKNDHDGCPDDTSSGFRQGRLVLDERIFFDYAKSDLRPTGKTELDAMAQSYQSEGNWKSLKIQGHTDSRGSEDYNEDLSRSRAEAVKAYLVSKGIPADKLDVQAYGERAPLVPSADTESEYQKNRRVEFVIVR
jgi:outer membrane protein OmpA-like peptidoglycan-associated protein